MIEGECITLDVLKGLGDWAELYRTLDSSVCLPRILPRSERVPTDLNMGSREELLDGGEIFVVFILDEGLDMGGPTLTPFQLASSCNSPVGLSDLNPLVDVYLWIVEGEDISSGSVVHLTEGEYQGLIRLKKLSLINGSNI